MPKIKPNKLKLVAVKIKKAIIQKGCRIVIETKRFAVSKIIVPTIMDFVAAAPTNPIVISIKEIGADKTS